MLSILALTLSLAVPLSPEEFLATLVDSTSGIQGASFWVESASPRAQFPAIGADSMAVLLDGMASISVEPGNPRLIETDEISGSYLVEYPEAEWSWIDSEGRLIRASGKTRVEMAGGRYYWVELPVLEGGAYISPSHRLLAAFLVTVLVLGIAVMVLVWVRRRFIGS